MSTRRGTYALLPSDDPEQGNQQPAVAASGGPQPNPYAVISQPMFVPRRKFSCLRCLCWTMIIFLAFVYLAFSVVYLPLLRSPYKTEYHVKETVSNKVHSGELGNGMSYSIMHNYVKRGRFAAFVCVDAGSVDEDENERGMAHVVEHLAFDNTKDFPGRGGVWREVMKTGGWFNAFTSFRNTVYMLWEVPVGQIDNALNILKNEVSGQTHIEENLVLEKGAVLSEARLRNTSFSNVVDALLLNHGGDSWRIAKRSPIGTQKTLLQSTTATTSKFMKKWYTPDKFRLIFVGDLDVKSVETKVVQLFGAVNVGSPADRPVIGPIAPKKKVLLSKVDGVDGVWMNLLVTKPYASHPLEGNHYRVNMVNRLFSLLYFVNTYAKYRLMYPEDVLVTGMRGAACLIDNEYTFGSEIHIFSAISPGKPNEGPWRNDFEAALIELKRLAEEGPNIWLVTALLYVTQVILHMLESMQDDLDSMQWALLMLGDLDPGFKFMPFQDFSQLKNMHGPFLNHGFAETAAATIQAEAQFIWAQFLEIAGRRPDDAPYDRFDGATSTLNVFYGYSDSQFPEVGQILERDIIGVIQKVADMSFLGVSPLMSLMNFADSAVGLDSSLSALSKSVLSPSSLPSTIEADKASGIYRYKLGNGVPVNLKKSLSGTNKLPLPSHDSVIVRISSLGGGSTERGSVRGVCDFVNMQDFGGFTFEDDAGNVIEFGPDLISLIGGQMTCSDDYTRITFSIPSSTSDSSSRYGYALMLARLLMRPRYTTVNVRRAVLRMEGAGEELKRSKDPSRLIYKQLHDAINGDEEKSELSAGEAQLWVQQQFSVGKFEVSISGDVDIPLMLGALNKWIGTIKKETSKMVGYDVHEDIIPAAPFPVDTESRTTMPSFAADRAFVGLGVPAPSLVGVNGNFLKLKLIDYVSRSLLFDKLRRDNGYTYFVDLRPFRSILDPSRAWYHAFWAPGPYPTPKSADSLNVESSVAAFLQAFADNAEARVSVTSVANMMKSILAAELQSPGMWIEMMEGLSLQAPKSWSNVVPGTNVRSIRDLDFDALDSVNASQILKLLNDKVNRGHVLATIETVVM